MGQRRVGEATNASCELQMLDDMIDFRPKKYGLAHAELEIELLAADCCVD